MVVRGVSHLFDDLGHGNNTDAEWLALICALELANSSSLTEVELIGDALEVIEEAQKAMSTGRAKHRHAAKFLGLVAGQPMARIRWTKREQNLAGIALAARHPR